MFASKEDNKTIDDFRVYDNTIKEFSLRNDAVMRLLYDKEGNLVPFMAEYFSGVFNGIAGKDDSLSNEDSVCRLLDTLGTYLISAKDIQTHRQVEYRFWANKRDYKKYVASTEKPISSMTKKNSEGGDVEVDIVDMFVNRADRNFKTYEKTTIKKSDVKRIKEIEALQNAIDYFKSEKSIKAVNKYVTDVLNEKKDTLSEIDARRLLYVKNNTKSYLDSYKKDMRENQVLIKESVDRAIVAKNPLKDEGFPDKLAIVDDIGFSDINLNRHMLECLADYDTQSDEGIILMEFEMYCDKVKLSPNEQVIMDYLKRGFQQIDISEVTNIAKQSINRSIKKIAEKVAKLYVSTVHSKTIATKL